MPGIYVGTSPLKAAYVGTTPVKEVYVGTTKVRPTGWTPGANTIAYYPFDDQGVNGYVTDVVNGYNLDVGTQPTYTQVLGTNYAGNYSSQSVYTQRQVNDWTSYINDGMSIILWIKVTSNAGNQYFWMLNDGANQCAIIYNYNSGKIETYGDTRTTILSNTQLDTWYCIGWTRGNGKIDTYINGVHINNINTTHIQNNSLFHLGWGVYLIGECVVENTILTGTDMTSYYNLTKSNYGL